MSISSQNRTLFITHVDKLGPYLKICGHLNTAALGLIRARIQQLLKTCIAIDPTWPLERYEKLVQPGSVCLYKRVNGASPADFEFVRVRVLSADVVNYARLQVNVEFIDYGTNATVGSYELLLPESSEEVLSIPPLCVQCIVLGVCNDWSPNEINEVSRIITHQTVDISIIMELQQYKLITMMWKDFNFNEYLINQKKFGSPIANDLLLDSLKKMVDQQHIQQTNFNPNLIDSKRNKINNRTALNSSMEPVPVMPPVFSGPNNHRQNVITQTTQQFNGSHSLSLRLQQYGNNLQPLNTNEQYVNHQQLQYLQRPRIPHTIVNLRSMYQGPMPLIRTPVYASTPAVVLTSPFSEAPPPYIAEYASIRPQKYNPYQSVGNETVTKQQTSVSNTFKSHILAVGSTYDVYVSFVENGPCLFSVQLASAQDELTQMMNRLESVALKPLTIRPALGSACIARYSEDGQFYRALIKSVQPTVCKVSYIDYGNAELVQYSNIFEIPDDFLTQKPFAIRFTLAGQKQLQPLDESLKKAFKDLVLYHHCKLEVMPVEGEPIAQYCKLYLKEQNVLQVLKQIQKSRLVYAKAENLQSNDIVEIRYIDSPKHFYVQKVANIAKFENLMDEMYLYYNKNQVVPTQLALGSPCIVKFDKEWYRAEVMRADDTAIIVRHVDFGYEQKVTKHLLSIIAEQHLQLPRQAVQCCLKGFENSELNKDLATTQFEMLAEESNRKRRSFTVQVFRIEADGVNLVNLVTKELNVMKKLYKLSMPFEQYLTLEKEDFNMKNGMQKETRNKDFIQKSPSVTSSDAISSVHSSKKNTNMQKMRESVRKPNSPQHSPPQQQQKIRSVNQQADTYDGDKANHDNTKDGRYNSNERNNQRASAQKHQTNQGQSGKPANSLNVSMESRSSSSQPDNSISSRQSSNSHQKQGRSKNAPQGYSQSRQKTNNNNNSKSETTQNNSMKSTTTNSAVEEVKTTIEEFVPLDYAYPTQTIKTPAIEDVIICWWISPYQFYTHLKKRNTDFENLMSEMQRFYRKRPLQQLQLRVGANVIARHRQDNLVYRARIVGCNHMLRKYKVYFVDYGNQFTVTSEDIWQVEKRFANFPCMAYLCSFQNIISNFDHLHIIDCMDKYLPSGAALSCEYLKQEVHNKNMNIGGMYFVNIKVNGSSLRDAFINNGILTNVDNELRLDLFAGQQIRVKICDIKDLLNFKIQMEDQNLKFLSAFDDVRFVKSNPQMTKKFRDFYEGKWCAVNIKDVNDNKVLLLRPLAPLLKEEKFAYICPAAVYLEKFSVNILYVDTISRLYGQPLNNVKLNDQLLDDMYKFYEKAGETLENIEINQICAALSEDKNWYRARIESVENQTVTVFYIDYGNTEKLDKSMLKRLEEKFHKNKNANVLEINLPIRFAETTKTKVTADMILNTLNELVLDQEVCLKALEFRKHHLIADLFINKNESIVDVLEKKYSIKCRDLDYTRKQLDKDKKNIYEYIETVDLTVEEEVDESNDKKLKTKKKKTQANAVEENIKETGMSTNKKPDSTETIQTIPINVEKLSVQENEAMKVVKENTTATQIIVENKTTDQAEKTNSKNKVDDNNYTNMETAILSHCDNPAQFFIHSLDTIEKLRKLQENLQIIASSLPPLMGLHNGAYCISQYSVDKQWYRARVIDAELILLKFIDFGNTDCVSDTSELKEMYVFPDIEPFCQPCALPIKPNCTADWVDAANNIFNESYNKFLHYEYITRGDNEKLSFINLFVEGVNVTNKLVADGYAKRLEIVQSDENCYISHVNGIEDFYIQYEKESKALELIEIYLAENEKTLKPIEVFESGLIVAALFPDDKMWYRAKLLRHLPKSATNEVEKYEVLFIDYGNTSLSTEIREISAKISKLAPLSKRCSLELPANCLAWSDAAEEKFSEIAAQGETIFTIELREPKANFSLVHLLIDGRNINEDLSTLCQQIETAVDAEEANILNNSFCNTTFYSSFGDAPAGTVYEGIVCHVLTTNDFYIHFNKDKERFNDLIISLEQLQDEKKLQDIKEDEIIAALVNFNNSKKIVRVRILEIMETEARGFLIDYGFERTLQEFRQLSLGLQQVNPFAKYCKLADACTNTTIYEGQLLRVELINGLTEPALVRLCAESNHIILNYDSTVIETEINDFCIISHAISPENFYIQRKGNLAQLEFVTKTLQNKGKELEKFTNRKVEDLCVAFSEEDNIYYRAIIKVVHANASVEVLLIDYGNIICCDDLRILPEELNDIPELAEKCQLNAKFGTNLQHEQLAKQFLRLVDTHFGELFEIETEEKAENDTVAKLKLLINFENVADRLLQSIEHETELESTAIVEVLAPLAPILHDCTIIHFNSPIDFYIQMSTDIGAVEDLTYTLLDAETDFPHITGTVDIGQICAALFPEDGAYYRARILQKLDGGQYEVYYIDFGNNAITDQLRELPESMQSNNGYAKNCALHGLHDPLSLAACEIFQTLMNSRFTETFQVEFLNTTVQPIICNLYYEERNVASEIRELLNQKNE